jgi:hypothetical protein
LPLIITRKQENKVRNSLWNKNSISSVATADTAMKITGKAIKITAIKIMKTAKRQKLQQDKFNLCNSEFGDVTDPKKMEDWI